MLKIAGGKPKANFAANLLKLPLAVAAAAHAAYFANAAIFRTLTQLQAGNSFFGLLIWLASHSDAISVLMSRNQCNSTFHSSYAATMHIAHCTC